MIVNDAHIHVGQFYDLYTSSKELIELTKKVGINMYAVSSTTICVNNFDKVLSEFDVLMECDSGRAIPILWLTPELLADDKWLYTFLETGFRWVALKIHPDLHPYFWFKDNGFFDLVLDIAEELNLPILIHTSNKKYSAINNWYSAVRAHPTQIFVFAHCRPHIEAIEMISKFPNAYGDLAFVPVEELLGLIEFGLENKLMWGSDAPITQWFYRDIDIVNYYGKELDRLSVQISHEKMDLLAKKNFEKIYLKM